MLRLAVDFDGTIVTDGSPLQFRPGAREVLHAMKKAGHTLILFSRRSTLPEPNVPGAEQEVDDFYAHGQVPERALFQWGLQKEMLDFLRKAGVLSLFDEVWQSPGKPHADLFVDDKAESPDWGRLQQEFVHA